MAEELGRGKRLIKVRRDSAYSYDEKVLNALVHRNSSESESWHQCSDNNSNCVSINENASSSKKVSNFKINEVSSWNDIVFNSSDLENSVVKSSNVDVLVGVQSESYPATQSASVGASSCENINIVMLLNLMFCFYRDFCETEWFF